MADDRVQVQVVFTVEEGGVSFTDALYVPLDEYDAMSKDGRLDAMKRERFDGWRAALAAPPPDPVQADATVQTPVDQARQVLNDALAQLDALPQE